MRKPNRIMLVVAVVAVVLTASVVQGQDWPQWRGPNRAAKATGFNAPAQWPEQLNQKWKVTVGSGDSTPALVGDRLYVFTRVGNDETIRCLNADTGEEIWQDKYEAKAVTGPPSSHPGPRSSPTVADGKVVTFGVTGVISCLNADSGELLWRKNDFPDSWPRFFTSMSPIITDGICIAHLGNDEKGAVIAYNLTDGGHKWEWDGDGPTYSSPVLMTADGVKQVVVQTAKNLIGLTVADGKLLWKIETPVQRRYYSCATPIVNGQMIIYTGQGSGTKAVTIKKEGDSFVTEELWSNDELGTSFNTPVLKDGMLYGLSDNGRLYCMNAENGQTAWVGTEEINRFGSVVDAGACLLALSPQKELIVFEPNSSEYKELAKYKVADSEIYAYPIAAGNRIYVKDQDSVILWTVE